MPFPTDLEIARSASLKPLDDIAAEMGLSPGLLEPYGDYVKKIKLAAIEELADRRAVGRIAAAVLILHRAVTGCDGRTAKFAYKKIPQTGNQKDFK